VDALTYPGFRVLAHTLGLDLAPLPVTGAGPDLDVLERLCRRRRVRAVYTMPTLHNPLGWVLDDDRRARLVSIARRHRVTIVEDALVRLPRRGRAAAAGDARARGHRARVGLVEERRDRSADRGS
jgi:DNA-binding transcriptional MocR family regulator